MASEDRLGEQLSGIERRLGEVLEQRYTTAVNTGLRTLVDAGTTTDRRVHTDEVRRARDLFREAGASARSTLQVAIAERYLLLCAIALARHDAAETALRRLNRTATEVLLESGSSLNPAAAEMRATWQMQRESRRGSRRKRAARLPDVVSSILSAAAESEKLSGCLLREAGVLAEGLGQQKAPVMTWLEHEGSGIWDVHPTAAGPVRVGTSWVEWRQVSYRPSPPEQDAPAASTAVDTGARDAPASGTLEAHVIACADTPLSYLPRAELSSQERFRPLLPGDAVERPASWHVELHERLGAEARRTCT